MLVQDARGIPCVESRRRDVPAMGARFSVIAMRQCALDTQEDDMTRSWWFHIGAAVVLASALYFVFARGGGGAGAAGGVLPVLLAAAWGPWQWSARRRRTSGTGLDGGTAAAVPVNSGSRSRALVSARRPDHRLRSVHHPWRRDRQPALGPASNSGGPLSSEQAGKRAASPTRHPCDNQRTIVLERHRASSC